MIPIKQINFQPFSKELHVHPSGSNTEGTGAIEKPFATLEKARDIASTNTLIIVHPGTYIVTTTDVNGLGKDNVHWNFYSGTIIVKSTAGNLFGTSAMVAGYNIYGNGVFGTDTAAGIIYSNTLIGVNKIFECQAAISTIEKVIDISGGINIYIKAAHISSSFSDTIKIQAGGDKQESVVIDLGYCECTAAVSYPIKLSIDCYGAIIKGSYCYSGATNYGVYCNGALGSLTCDIGFCTGYYNNTGINVSINGDCSNIDFIEVSAATINGYCNNATIANTNNSSQGIVFNGRVEVLNITSGNVTATCVNTFAITDGSLRISQLIAAIVSVAYSTINGGFCLIDNGANTNMIRVNGGHLVYNGGTNNYLGSSAGPNFELIGGVLEIRGRVKNPNTGSGGIYNCIYWSGGDLILNGAILIRTDSNSFGILAVNPGLEVRILAGGVSYNNFVSLLGGSRQIDKIIITSAVNSYTYTNTINGNLYSYIATVPTDTPADIATALAALVNGDGDVTVTYTPGDDFYIIEADAIGTPYMDTIAAANMTKENIELPSYTISDLTGGNKIQSLDVI